jgi:hypothetical protein
VIIFPDFEVATATRNRWRSITAAANNKGSYQAMPSGIALSVRKELRL